jgi:YVTN family beta-propeller protein
MTMRKAWTMAVLSWAVATAGMAAGPEGTATGSFARDGLVIDFAARAPMGRGAGLREGDIAEIEFRIREEATGNPVRSNVPAAWLDLADVIRAKDGGEQKSCKDKVALYLRGIVGIRPMVDLNSYHVVVMNQDASVTVIDPLVSMGGSTSTLATVRLKQRGTDWAAHAAGKSIFVTMPGVNEVAVIDTETFRIKGHVAAGESPTRAALQPDGRYLWVGNNAAGAGGGVTAIDTASLEPAGFVGTGSGHHEIAFSADSRLAFVTNRDDGTVSVIDTQARRKLRDLRTGSLPISIARSALSGSLYVADGRDGTVTVVDAGGVATGKRIRLAPGLGPLKFTPDGRFGFVLDPAGGKVRVIDASSDSLVHTIDVEPEPYQLAFSRAFAYVRSLGSERVTMVNLSSLGAGGQPIVQKFAAGSGSPSMARDLALADSLAPASTEAAMVVVNPVENATYFYMEGMNAPASSYKAMGARARAVMLVDRSLKEVEPGVYRTFARLPAAGRYDVAVLLNSPRIVHCFSAEVAEDPRLAALRKPTRIEFLSGGEPGTAGERRVVRFRLTDSATGKPRAGLSDVRVLAFLAPGRNRVEKTAREVSEGVYEVDFPLEDAGAYYVRASSPTARFGFQDLPYLTIRVNAGKSSAEPGAGAPRVALRRDPSETPTRSAP